MNSPPGGPDEASDSASFSEGRFFYGWVMVGVCFATQFMITGGFFYAFSVSLIPLADEFTGGERAPITALMLASGIVGAILAPFIGRIVARNWIRFLMVTGSLALGLGLLGIAYSEEIWELGLLFATLLAFAGNALSGVTATTAVVNWFEKKRATALAFSQIGSSLGGVVMAPVVGWMVAEQGWRMAYQSLGIASLAMAPILWFLVVGRPEDSRAPGGKKAGPVLTDFGGAEPKSFETRAALRERNLWLVALVTGIAFMATTGLLNNIVAFGTDSGFDGQRAAWLASTTSAGAVLGKLVFGALSDRVGPVSAFAVSLLNQALGFVGLALLDGFWMIVSMVFVTGLGLGGTLPLSTSLLARIFGREAFGPMMGLMWPIAIPLQLIGPIFAAWIYDYSGSYRPAFWAFVVSLGLAALALRAIRVPAVEPGLGAAKASTAS